MRAAVEDEGAEEHRRGLRHESCRNEFQVSSTFSLCMGSDFCCSCVLIKALNKSSRSIECV
jgi:hypothetical protein